MSQITQTWKFSQRNSKSALKGQIEMQFLQENSVFDLLKVNGQITSKKSINKDLFSKLGKLSKAKNHWTNISTGKMT